MKKRIIIVGLVVAAVIGVICLAIFKADKYPTNADVIYEPSEQTGFIAEKIVGDPDKAELIIYEYADYGCSHCADWNKTINETMEKYAGKIALVFRSFDIGFQNGPEAARAATAAQIQGYFKEYKDLLFSNQAEWSYAEGAELDELFVKYFEKVSGGVGDVTKFKEDIKSDAVKTRLKFEQNMGKKVKLAGTPMFRIDGETIPLGDLTKTIEQKLGQ